MAIGINVEVDRQTDIYIEREIFLRKVYSPETTSEAYTTTKKKKKLSQEPQRTMGKGVPSGESTSKQGGSPTTKGTRISQGRPRTITRFAMKQERRRISRSSLF